MIKFWGEDKLVGVYVHIPFCISKCNYCDFNSYSGMSSYYDKYITALQNEIKAADFKQKIDTVYFGGGTPTVYPAPELLSVLKQIYSVAEISKDCEITAECNPGTIDIKNLTELRKGGFNRLSIGLQSTEDKMLKILGRIHNYNDFQHCIKDAKKAGFDNISIDLIYGLPGQTIENWMKTIKKAVSFTPNHVSCYALKIEPETPFYRMKLDLPNDDITREMYDAAVDILHDYGYERYEISNFAIKGFESRHNLKYWLCDDYIGFGAGAYSCLENKRFSNIKSVVEYCDRQGKGCVDLKTLTDLGLNDRMSEFCFLGLRLSNGISEIGFKERFGIDINKVYGDVIKKNISRGTLKRKDGKLKIPDEYIFVSNAILSDFV